MQIDITGLDKVAIVRALHAAGKPVGVGVWIAATGGLPTDEEIRGQLDEVGYFDYLRGVPLKIDMTKNLLDVRLYDMNHGEGVARRALAALLGKAKE